ncbi:MAG: peptide-methionine (S)-S-oxide reductase MsrA [Sphingomonadales bacterium]
MEKALFGAGCFWGVEAAFKEVEGVTTGEVGYAGGTTEDTTYNEVCSGNTGHAEVVLVSFDPGKVSFEELLEVFWSNHNPTTRDRQGVDFGSQYRSVIFTFNEYQQKTAETSKADQDASGRFKAPIVTQIEPVSSYFKAEEYHQDYFAKQGIEHCPI